ncbi:putative protein N(5)-glutamine methyltransferase [Nocardioides sp. InS609-2]|uniref:putative protein N(5)-glutamine methyltransferase n=1 Tax=Nocardioides sp. InS609-2 TaxID=2760705 RepID=UPI0017967C69|nr:putative protein N(5)-glutamine methyltransferase [Nocardioides sp. InS609-2]MBA3780529.1 putative protein N(5)-glutamine methyltransferase [Nocardioides sp.]
MADQLGVSEVAARLRESGSVFAEEEAELLLAQFDGSELAAAVLDRVAGEPLEHILGWAEFAGVRIHVAAGVFVPRRRSEILLQQALAHLPRHGLMVELCCGAAPVATAIAAARVDATVFASDHDPAAVACARLNLEPLGGHAEVGDMAASVPVEYVGRVDVLVANAPYVPTDEIALMPSEARLHEPAEALDGGPDGTNLQDLVAAAARPLLAPTGVVIIETSRRQADTTASRMLWRGFVPEVVLDDEVDGTCVIGRRQ